MKEEAASKSAAAQAPSSAAAQVPSSVDPAFDPASTGAAVGFANLATAANAQPTVFDPVPVTAVVTGPNTAVPMPMARVSALDPPSLATASSAPSEPLLPADPATQPALWQWRAGGSSASTVEGSTMAGEEDPAGATFTPGGDTGVHSAATHPPPPVPVAIDAQHVEALAAATLQAKRQVDALRAQLLSLGVTPCE